jgi:hypothetical protein
MPLVPAKSIAKLLSFFNHNMLVNNELRIEIAGLPVVWQAAVHSRTPRIRHRHPENAQPSSARP